MVFKVCLEVPDKVVKRESKETLDFKDPLANPGLAVLPAGMETKDCKVWLGTQAHEVHLEVTESLDPLVGKVHLVPPVLQVNHSATMQRPWQLCLDMVPIHKKDPIQMTTL